MGTTTINKINNCSEFRLTLCWEPINEFSRLFNPERITAFADYLFKEYKYIFEEYRHKFIFIVQVNKIQPSDRPPLYSALIALEKEGHIRIFEETLKWYRDLDKLMRLALTDIIYLMDNWGRFGNRKLDRDDIDPENFREDYLPREFPQSVKLDWKKFTDDVKSYKPPQ